MNKSKNNQRAKEFIECVGNGNSIYECEADNENIEDMLKEKIKLNVNCHYCGKPICINECGMINGKFMHNECIKKEILGNK